MIRLLALTFTLTLNCESPGWLTPYCPQPVPSEPRAVAAFRFCMRGPGVPYPVTTYSWKGRCDYPCWGFDVTGDDDVDLEDYAKWMD